MGVATLNITISSPLRAFTSWLSNFELYQFGNFSPQGTRCFLPKGTKMILPKEKDKRFWTFRVSYASETTGKRRGFEN